MGRPAFNKKGREVENITRWIDWAILRASQSAAGQTATGIEAPAKRVDIPLMAFRSSRRGS